MARVRFADESDTEAIVGLARDLIAESPRFRNFSPSTPKIRATVQAAITLPNGCAIVAEHDGRIVGVILAFVVDVFFGFDRIVSDAIVYVAPEHRGSPTFVRMARELEWWAKAQQADEIDLGISSAIDAENTVRVYKRLGFRLSTYTLAKDLRDV